jgi:hypothetical protein
MHVVCGSKLEKFVKKLSFEQNVKNHHKFGYYKITQTIYIENSHKIIS